MLVALVALIVQIRAKATLEMGSDAINITLDLTAAENYDDDELFQDTISDDGDVEGNSKNDKVGSSDESETYSELGKQNVVNASDVSNDNLSSESEHVGTLNLENSRLGVNYRPRGYGLRKSRHGNHRPVDEKTAPFSQELNKKTPENVNESIDTASETYGDSDDVHEPADLKSEKYPTKTHSINIDSNVEPRDHSIDTFTQRADVEVVEQPHVVNPEYYQFGHSHGNDQDLLDMDLEKHLFQHQAGIAHSHMDEQDPSISKMEQKYEYPYDHDSRSGIAYVPVYYHKRNQSNEVFYEPVYPHHRFRFYVPTVYPQYLARMKKIQRQPSQPTYDAITKGPTSKVHDTQSNYYQQVNI